LRVLCSTRAVRISTWYEHESTQEAFSFLRFVFAAGPREMTMLPSLGEEYELGKRPIKPLRSGGGTPPPPPAQCRLVWSPCRGLVLW
jgi:hypothetical protein